MVRRQFGQWFGAWWVLLLYLVIGTWVTVSPPYDNTPAIRSDGLGYHAWTRAILDGHISFCGYDELLDVQAISPRQPSTGGCANKYPPGLALLRFPVMAPFTAVNHGALRSPAEDRANQICSLAAGAVALGATLLAARRLGVGRGLASAGTLAMAFGTGLFHYATYDSSFTHVYSAALVALLMLFGVVHLARADGPVVPLPRRRFAAGTFLFVATGFLVGVRLPSLLVLAAMIGIAAVRLTKSPTRRSWTRLAVCSIGPAMAVVVISQFAYNRLLLGRWTFSSYAGEHFDVGQLKELPVLGGFRKGLVTWYPIVLVAFAATVATRWWKGMGTLIAFTVPLVVLYGSWHSWNLAGGFGHRGFVEVAPIYGLVLACSLQRASAAVRAITLTAGAAATVMTLSLMSAYWGGRAGFGGTTRAQWVEFTVGRGSLPGRLLRRVGGA